MVWLAVLFFGAICGFVGFVCGAFYERAAENYIRGRMEVSDEHRTRLYSDVHSDRRQRAVGLFYEGDDGVDFSNI